MARTRRQTTSSATPDAREGRGDGVPVFLEGGVVYVADPAAEQFWRDAFADMLANAFSRVVPALTPDRALLERVALAPTLAGAIASRVEEDATKTLAALTLVDEKLSGRWDRLPPLPELRSDSDDAKRLKRLAADFRKRWQARLSRKPRRPWEASAHGPLDKLFLDGFDQHVRRLVAERASELERDANARAGAQPTRMKTESWLAECKPCIAWSALPALHWLATGEKVPQQTLRSRVAPLLKTRKVPL